MILTPWWVPDFSINVAAGVAVAAAVTVLGYLSVRVRRLWQHRAFDDFWGSRARARPFAPLLPGAGLRPDLAPSGGPRAQEARPDEPEGRLREATRFPRRRRCPPVMPGVGDRSQGGYILVTAFTGISGSHLACESPAPRRVFVGL